MIGEDRQPGINYDRDDLQSGINYDRTINPQQSYTRSTDYTNTPVTGSSTTSKTTGVNQPSASMKGEFDNKPAEKGINPALAGALMGGLIGASLGALNGAFNGKKASHGFNYTVKGVGSGVKNVTEGLTHTAKGLGQVFSSLGQGITYSVVGGAQDTVEGLGEAAKKAVDTVQDTATSINSTVANTVQDAATNINSAVTDTANLAKDATDTATSSVSNTMASNPEVRQSETSRINEIADRTNYNTSSTAMSDEVDASTPDDRVIVRSNF